ncbi:MAG: TfoX/Sxy family protein [Plectolyngbya sp. WJT66-NPBG17]|jgi:TfoX/Sxy family transcriptional regulator of competence genes|nr:TfoX/Sxy family protein [Plectolyngbya sp. WJT66-NPBG17]
MASNLNFVEYVRDQINEVGRVSFKKMFGEYAVYYDEKVVALVCENQLFIKPTPGGRSMIGRVVEAPPYPGAKPHFLIGEQLDDRQWLSDLIQLTANEVPAPKPKKLKPKKASL